MLHHSGLLVVGFFDQKTIVFDHVDGPFIRGA